MVTGLDEQKCVSEGHPDQKKLRPSVDSTNAGCYNGWKFMAADRLEIHMWLLCPAAGTMDTFHRKWRRNLASFTLYQIVILNPNFESKQHGVFRSSGCRRDKVAGNIGTDRASISPSGAKVSVMIWTPSRNRLSYWASYSLLQADIWGWYRTCRYISIIRYMLRSWDDQGQMLHTNIPLHVRLLPNGSEGD